MEDTALKSHTEVLPPSAAPHKSGTMSSDAVLWTLQIPDPLENVGSVAIAAHEGFLVIVCHGSPSEETGLVELRAWCLRMG